METEENHIQLGENRSLDDAKSKRTFPRGTALHDENYPTDRVEDTMNGGSRAVLTVVVAGLLIVTTGAPAVATQDGGEVVIDVIGNDVQPGETALFVFQMTNVGDQPADVVLNATLPENWEIVNRSDAGGEWNATATKWTFEDVPVEGSTAASLTLSVPEDASGEFRVRATTLTNGTEHDAMVLGDVETETATGTAGGSTDGPAGADSTETTGPGFGPAVAGLAIAGAGALLSRRA